MPGLSGGCFDAGTMVTLADGTKKAIEDITTDDYVLSYNTATKTFGESKVTGLFRLNTNQDLVVLNFSDGTEL